MLWDAFMRGVKSGCLKSSMGVGTVTIKSLYSVSLEYVLYTTNAVRVLTHQKSLLMYGHIRF